MGSKTAIIEDFLNYYRLRDIETPPFAYVINREEVIESCELCYMPFIELKVPLKVEIFTTDVENWKSQIPGKPIMAESWVIGDRFFKEKLEKLLPGAFYIKQVEISSFLRKTPQAMRKRQSEKSSQHQPGAFYSFHPREKIFLDRGLKKMYPPIDCPVCKRAIPDIPFDAAIIPDIPPSRPQAGCLADLPFEGYDYLFHECVVPVLQKAFPKMLFEELSPEPFLF
ncbi:MAG: hypothetical protein CSA81_09195 [Acidobacteria bacterium]|nr:MAG: hypothetical protein CSA81_09195 [Acidobacteriota bacterium]PIE90120.1 MAG: hypothetical protein CR997_07615 [Acidobacteriota bacterium]